MGISTTVVRPTEGDLGKYEESLRKMKKLSPRIIYSGHGPVITEPIARLDYLLEHRLKRENELFKLLKMSSMKIDELCELLIILSPWVYNSQHKSVVAGITIRKI